MAELEYECGCKIDFEGNHCCGAHDVDLCEMHLIQLKAKEKREFEMHSKWVKEHPDEAMKLAQAYINAMSGDESGLVVRDILPETSEHQ